MRKITASSSPVATKSASLCFIVVWADGPMSAGDKSSRRTVTGATAGSLALLGLEAGGAGKRLTMSWVEAGSEVILRRFGELGWRATASEVGRDWPLLGGA